MRRNANPPVRPRGERKARFVNGVTSTNCVLADKYAVSYRFGKGDQGTDRTLLTVHAAAIVATPASANSAG